MNYNPDFMNYNNDKMYDELSGYIIGFHGCTRSVFENVLYKSKMLKMSRNPYDRLGNGIYFREQNLERAWEWAEEHSKNEPPAVIGAIIDPGYCLNLLDSKMIDTVSKAYQLLSVKYNTLGKNLPQNTIEDFTGSFLVRKLDCAVIEHLHSFRKDNSLKPFDTVRGVFLEGEQIYPNSGFRRQNHIQICVRNPNCIKGLFEPREFIDDWENFLETS